jgi:hypothetical protein
MVTDVSVTHGHQLVLMTNPSAPLLNGDQRERDAWSPARFDDKSISPLAKW